MIQLLRNQGQLADWIQQFCSNPQLQPMLERAESRKEEWRTSDPVNRRAIVRALFRRITLKPTWLCLELDRKQFLNWLAGDDNGSELEIRDQASADGSAEKSAIHTIEHPLTIKRRGVEARLILTDQTQRDPCPDPTLIDLIVRANRYLRSLTDSSEKSINAIGQQHRIDPSEVSRLLPFAFLSPKIIEGILTGTQPRDLTAKRMARISDLPTDWNEQEQLLGF